MAGVRVAGRALLASTSAKQLLPKPFSCSACSRGVATKVRTTTTKAVKKEKAAPALPSEVEEEASPTPTSPIPSTSRSSFPGNEPPPDQLTPPTLSDLDQYYPLRVPRFPSETAGESLKIVYRQEWQAMYARIDAAFTKKQLYNLLEPWNLAPILGSNEGIKGKVPRLMAKKKLDFKSTKETLIIYIIVGKWGFRHPKMLDPKMVTPTSTTVELDDKTLFLMLAKDSPASEQFESLKVRLSSGKSSSPSSSPSLSMTLKGLPEPVMEAKEYLASFANTRPSQRIPLPIGSMLHPQALQAISRVSQVFLEPDTLEPDNFIIATAIDAANISTAKHLIQRAYIHNSLNTTTPLFILPSPSSPLTSPTYAFHPFRPPTSLSPLLTSGTPSLTRLKTISSFSEIQQREKKISEELVEALKSFDGGLEVEEEVAKRVGKGEESVLESLKKSFGEEEGEVEMLVEFGNIVWPVFENEKPRVVGSILVPGSTGSEELVSVEELVEDEELLMGPGSVKPFKLEGFEKLMSQGEKPPSFFVPSLPPNFLSSTGIFDPLPTSADTLGSKIDSIFSSMSDSATSSSPLEPTEVRKMKTAIEAKQFKRVVYRPESVEEGVEEVVEIEIEVLDGEEMGSETKVEVRKVRRSNVDVLLPDLPCDTRFTLSHTTPLSLTTLSFDPLSSPVPSTLTLPSSPKVYILDTSSQISHTTFTPTSTPSSDPIWIQERFETAEVNNDHFRGGGVKVLIGKKGEGLEEKWKKGWRVARRIAEGSWRGSV